MNIIFRIIGILFIVLVLICAYSFFTDKTNYTQWYIKSVNPDTSGISWSKFKWTNDTIGDKYFERTSMIIPCQIEGLPYHFTFQFDLGAIRTEIYENTIRSFFKLQPGLDKKIKRLKSTLQFWNSNKTIQDLTITFGNIRASTAKGYLHKNYGKKLSASDISNNETYDMGTIGADIFQNKILIIDYPNQRFTICDSLPHSYNITFSRIELDRTGRVLLPMQLKEKNYSVLFDNGSSIFPLLVTDDNINDFSTSSNTDTININSWGTRHDVVGRLIADSFLLAGRTFSKVTAYADYRNEFRTKTYDAITGNILFWDNTVIIDFKNKKFRVK